MSKWQEEDMLIVSNLTGLPMSTNYTGPSRLASSLGATIMLMFFLEGMIGNLWIVVAVMSKRQVWNIINLFIASLCFNELLVGSLTVYVIIDSYIWQEWTAGELMCKLGPEFTIAFTGCSLWHTAFIAIHRYIVVVHNDAYKRMSKKAYVTFVLVVARLIPFACTFPGFSLNTSGYVPKLLRCIILPNQGARMISITMVQIIAPCVIVVLCYALVFGFVLKIARQINNSNLMMQREIQITKMFGVIFLMILLGFIPYAVVRNADRGNELHADVYVIVTVFYGIATCSSPLIYGTMSTEIRSVCMACLRQTCVFTGLFKCIPCFKLWDSSRCLNSVSNATIMDPKEIEVRDAQTQIENGSAPRDKLISMKEVNENKVNGNANTNSYMASSNQGDINEENSEQEERLLQQCNSLQDIQEEEVEAGEQVPLQLEDRDSVVEMIGVESNGEPHLMLHKQLCQDRHCVEDDMLDTCHEGCHEHEGEDCASLSPCSETEVKVCDGSLDKTEVALLSNGCNTIIAV